MTKNVFITGCFGFGNTGDEAILIAMVAHLRELRPGIRITATSATPQATAEALGIGSVLWSDACAMMEAVRAADLVVIGGGGIFHDYWGMNPGTFLTDQHWGISFYTAPAAMAVLFDKPVMLYAVGVGPLLSDHARNFTRFACDLAARITVRDSGSGPLLASLGVATDRIETTADPAFGLAADGHAIDVDALLGPRTGGPRIAVALRPWNVGIDQKFWEREVAAGLDLYLEHHPGRVIFLPFQREKNSPDDDSTVAARVLALMKRQDRAAVVLAELPPPQTAAVLAQCDLVVGMRLHSLILGMVSKVPVAALSYDAKIDRLMESAGLMAFCLEIRSVDSGLLARTIEEALQEKRVVPVDSFAEAARQNARIAVEILDCGAPRPVLSTAALALLGSGLEAQLREIRELREENRRFFREFEHYQKLSTSQASAAEALSARIDELEREKSAASSRWEQVSEFRKLALGKEAAWREERSALLARCEDFAVRMQTESDRAEAAWKRQRAELLARGNLLSAALADAERATAAMREQNARRDEEAHRHAAIQAGLTAQIKSLESAAETQRLLQTSLEEDVRDSRAANRSASERLQRGDILRRKAVEAVDRFHVQFSSALETYRSQRAWRAMLAIRKGYTTFSRRGVAAFLRWAVALPFSGPGPLAEAELRFPSIWDYMPERLEAEERPVENAPQIEATRRCYDVVIFAIFDFEFRFQRPQQIAAQFARLGHRVFWVSPARFLAESSAEHYQAVPLRENIWEVRLRGPRPDLYGGEMGLEQEASYAQSLETLYRDFHISESCALLQFPYWRRMGLKLRETSGARVVYDCMDDWRNWTAEPRIGEFSLGEERKLAAECDVLVVSAQRFYDRHAQAGLRPVLVRNGADFDFFSSPRANNLLADIETPIVGYYGAIADWFDIELLTDVAESRPQYTFVVIGQVHEIDISRLRGLRNVQLLGEKNYREIPLYLSHFDVCLIPFKLNSLTSAVDPVKLYEYFSQGKPVVATDMGELPQDAELLYIGRDKEDFATKIDAAMAEKNTAQQPRIDYARRNTWAVRCDDIGKAVVGCFPRVSILIVTYDCEEFVGPCLDSILRNTSWPNYEVIVVDNDSADTSAEILERYARSHPHIRLTRNHLNSGFAGANNLAAQQAEGQYLVFLNPDTIVPPGWLGRLIRHCERDTRNGAVAAVTNFSGNETKIGFAYRNAREMEKFALDLSVEKANQSQEVAVAPLYCVLVPRSVWDLVGGLDAGYQIGMFEDDDFSHLIKKAGYRVIAAEDCFVHHFGNGSFAKLLPQESLRIFEQNKQYFETKWKTAWVPHKLRPGVRPPNEEIRFTPGEFVSAGYETAAKESHPLIVRRLHPPVAVERRPFNQQADGGSALVVECAHATPTTVVVMGTTLLPTSYGSENLLSATVPVELYQEAGCYPVSLANDFGNSNRVDFIVERESAASA